jgi:DNA-directed RNA polymerase specialized sigma24 family protein
LDAETIRAGLVGKARRALQQLKQLGTETAEICKELSVTPTHCRMLPYRARLALQLRLDKNWFGK